MKTTVYLVRHAESDHAVKDAKTRPLTEKGLKDSETLAEHFRSIPVSRIFSSPYLRAVQTVMPLAKMKNLPIETDDRVREWMGGRPFPAEIFENRMREMFEDEASTNGGAESLKALRKRSREFLMHILTRFPGDTLVIGTHALALTAFVMNIDKSIGLDFLMNLLPITPFIVKITFENFDPVSVEYSFSEKPSSKEANQ